jgi:hypothetical protein
MIIFTIMICSALVAPVLADDCTRDPLNAQDCLRTDGYAEAMAGLIATILSALINGPIIVQTFLQGATGAVTGVQPPAPPSPPAQPQGPFVGDKMSFVDTRGEHRTAVLQADGHWLTDEGTWYDPDYAALLAEGQKIDAANAAWRADHAAQDAKDAVDFKNMTDGFKAQLDAAKNYKSPDTAAFQKWYKDFLARDNALNQAAADRANLTASLLDYATRGAEVTEKCADISIDVLSKVAGPEGKAIKTAYTSIKDITKSVSSSYATGQDLRDGLIKGVEDAVVDYTFDKAKEKFIKATDGKVPFFKDFKGVDKGNSTMTSLGDAISNAGKPLNWTMSTTTSEMGKAINQAMIRDALRNGALNRVQSQVQTFIIKDPLKRYLGIKK